MTYGKEAALSLALCLLAGPCEPGGKLVQACEPNVVVILADDLGYHDCSLYSPNAWHPTNALNRIAADGCVFERAYACPLCSASRGTLLTGRSSARTQVTAATGHKPDSFTTALAEATGPVWSPAATVRSATRLKAGYVTLAETFQAAGYATGQFGKWHVGGPPYGPGEQGFDVHMPDTFDRPGPPQGGYLGWTAPTMSPDPANEHIEDRLKREVCGFIADHREEPFFVLYEMFSVHGPWEAKPGLLADYQALPNPENRSPTYGAMVATLNTSVGGVLDTLDALGLSDRTIVVFVSDNGGNTYNTAPDEAVPITTNAPLRGGKGTLWEGGIRVPLVIRAPGVTTGSRSAELAQLSDLYPTLCDLCDLTPPAGVTGLSLVPALLGQEIERDAIFTFFPHASPSVPDFTFSGAAVHDREGFKLLREFYVGERLFDLNGDPAETTDISASDPERVAELSLALELWLAESQAVLPVPNPEYAP